MPTGRTRRPGTAALALAAAMLASACGLASWAAGAPDDAEPVDRTREALTKWVDTQRAIAKERRDLALAKEMLHERIELIQREVSSLRKKIAAAEKGIAETEAKREKLSGTNDKLKKTSSTLREALATMETRSSKLLARLPEPIRQKVRPLSQRFPEDTEETDLSASQRFQNVLGVLNMVNKFHSKLEVQNEVRELADGEAAQVTAVYVGISRGFYVGGNGTVAGVGAPTAEGWSWQSRNEAADRIARAIAILNNEEVAAFVRLPVKVK